MSRFSGRIALVAGVDTPAGAALVQQLAREGARVSGVDFDVLSESAWAAAIAAAGRFDLLAISIDTEHTTPLLATPYPAFDRLFARNVLAPWLGLKLGVRALRAAGQGGAIVTIAAGGRRPIDGLVATTVQGLRLMTRSAARECAARKDGIRVNAVEAGVAGPAAAPVAPDDLAAAALHLFSPESLFTTGATLTVGGAAAQPGAPAFMPRDEGSLRGKVALVTGATSGLGRACAVSLAKRGARVVVSGRNVDRGNETLAAIRAAGSDGLVLRHDVTSEADWQEVLARTVQAFGPLDILVNNAGDRKPGEMTDTGLDTARLVQRVNVHSTFLGIKHGHAVMPAGGGVILNMSSIGGLHGSVGNVDYSASKAMVTYLSRVAAVELAAKHIRSVAISPGVFFTEGFYRNRTPEQAEIDKKATATRIPIGFGGEPADLGEVMAFLVSNDARALSGIDFVVDGGATA